MPLAVGFVVIAANFFASGSVMAQKISSGDLGAACCVYGVSDTCFLYDQDENTFGSESQCKIFGDDVYGYMETQGVFFEEASKGVAFDNASWERCNAACSEGGQFFYCQNRQDYVDGFDTQGNVVSAPVCAPGKPANAPNEKGFFAQGDCETACLFNRCEYCDSCNGQYPCDKFTCEMNPSCIAGDPIISIKGGADPRAANVVSCTHRPETSCAESSSSSSDSSSSSTEVTVEMCCIKEASPPFAYIGISNDEQSALRALYGTTAPVFDSATVRDACADTYTPYHETVPAFPSKAYVDDFLNRCRSGTQPSSSSSTSSSSSNDPLVITACCHPQAKTVLLASNVGGSCAACTTDSQCGIGAGCSNGKCLLAVNNTACLADNQCNSNQCVTRSGNQLPQCTVCTSNAECGAECSNGKCNGYSEGSSCYRHGECASQYCDNGRCAAQVETGDPCTYNSQCTSGYCKLGPSGSPFSDNGAKGSPDLLNNYADEGVQIQDYAVVEECSWMRGASIRSWRNQMPDPANIQQFKRVCSLEQGSSSAGSSSSDAYYNKFGIYPFPTPPNNIKFPSTPPPPDAVAVICDRRLGPYARTPEGNICPAYNQSEYVALQDHYTVFLGQGGADACESGGCEGVRNLLFCVLESGCGFRPFSQCIAAGGFGEGIPIPADLPAGFDRVTPDAVGNIGVDKYALQTCCMFRDIQFTTTAGCEPFFPEGYVSPRNAAFMTPRSPPVALLPTP